MKPIVTFMLAVVLGVLSANVIAQDLTPKSVKYPDVVFREGVPEILYPPAGDKHFLLPNGLPDVVTNIRRNGIHSPWYLTTFFGNKRIRLKHYNQQNRRATLMTGEVIELDFSPSRDVIDEFRGGGIFGGIGVDDLYQLEDGSFIGREAIVDPSGGGYLRCNVSYGIVRFSPDRQVLWRKVYVHIDKKADFKSPFWGSCTHYRDQRLMEASTYFDLLPDGNFAITSASKLIRINSATGLPFGKVPEFYMADSGEFQAFKEATYSRLKNYPGHPDFERNKDDGSNETKANFEEADFEAEFYRAIQNFFIEKN